MAVEFLKEEAALAELTEKPLRFGDERQIQAIRFLDAQGDHDEKVQRALEHIEQHKCLCKQCHGDLRQECVTCGEGQHECRECDGAVSDCAVLFGENIWDGAREKYYLANMREFYG